MVISSCRSDQDNPAVWLAELAQAHMHATVYAVLVMPLCSVDLHPVYLVGL